MARMIDGNWKDFLLNLSVQALMDFQENRASLSTLRTAVEEQPTLTQPNEPLTLEELSLCNDPVWIKRLAGEDLSCDGWAIVEGPGYLTWFMGLPMSWEIRVWWPGSEVPDYPKHEDYGKTWWAYRRPPEGGNDVR